MLNFTVGPVQSSKEILEIGSEQVPYFRTPEFSKIMLENEALIKKLAKAPSDAKAIFLTGSGTAAMEATVMNVLNTKDKALIINGGSFGARFVKLCQLHGIAYEELKLDTGCGFTKKDLEKYENSNFTCALVNYHETSTGELYDINLLSDFCKRNNMLLIVDCISAFLADEFDMEKLNADVMITGSQKALACPPGISIIVLADRAVKRVYNNESKSMYLDLKSALENAQRGQTPFTPAVSILRQINKRLHLIDENGGVSKSIQNTKELAAYFRESIKDLPLEIVPDNCSNAVSALHPLKNNAYEIFTVLKDNYQIWVCPNGGDLKDKIFRVGHIGALTKNDYDKLLVALKTMHEQGIF